MKRLFVIALCLIGSATAFAQTPVRHKVNIMAMNADNQVVRLCSSLIELERKATSEFKKEKRFAVVNSIADSDFVFLIFMDPKERYPVEQALAVNASDFNVDSTIPDLRAKAFWSATGTSRTARNAAVGMATMGWGNINKSVSKDLVKQFHKDVK